MVKQDLTQLVVDKCAMIELVARRRMVILPKNQTQ